MVGVAESPRLVRIEVCVSANAGAREVGVCEEAALAVKRRAVTVKTGGKKDHDISFLPLVLDLRVRHLLEATAGKWSQEMRCFGGCFSNAMLAMLH